MIYSEHITVNGQSYIRTYSDTFMIARDGELYGEAIDPIDSGRVYTESDTPLDNEEVT